MSHYATIYVACQQLNYDEDMRRTLYQRVTNKRSLTQMSEQEHQKVIEELKAKGFRPTSKHNRKRLEGRFAPKLQALWIAAWNLGLIKNRDDQAMLKFIKRQTGIEHTRFLINADDADKVIEALKSWMAREAEVSWYFDKQFNPSWLAASGARIAVAQWKILIKQNLAGSLYFSNYVSEMIGKELFDFTNQDWIKVMNALGCKIRSM